MLRGPSVENSPVSWQLPLIMIFKDHHSYPRFTLPKYPRSQNLTPLRPLVSWVGGVKSCFLPFFAVFHANFYPGCPFFRPKTKVKISYSIWLRFLLEEFPYIGAIRKIGPFKDLGGSNAIFQKKASFLEASHLMSFHFIQIPSNKALLYDILWHNKGTYWK